MFDESENFASRALALMLALVIGAFPAAALSSSEGDCTGHGKVTVACCEQTENAESDESSSGDREDGSRDCGVHCVSLCCRAIDQTRNDMRPVGARTLILAVVLFAQSVETPIICDAIFHPPRA